MAYRVCLATTTQSAANNVAGSNWLRAPQFLMPRPWGDCGCVSCTAWMLNDLQGATDTPSGPYQIKTITKELAHWNVWLPFVGYPVPNYWTTQPIYIDNEVMGYLILKQVINWCPQACALFPIKTIGDGNCLPHAIALALWGVEDTTMLLRRQLYTALVEAGESGFRERWKREKEWQNSNIPDGGLQYSPAEWESEWNILVHAADNIYRQFDNNRPMLPYESLEEMHVFVLANILRRPIIILGEPELGSPFSEYSLGHNNFVGIYLPLLWPARECSKGPIVLAFMMNHFQPLVTQFPVLPNDTAWHHANFVPLVTSSLEMLHIHFLLENEEAKAHTVLQEYLSVAEIEQQNPNAERSVILIAFLARPETLYLNSSLLREEPITVPSDHEMLQLTREQIYSRTIEQPTQPELCSRQLALLMTSPQYSRKKKLQFLRSCQSGEMVLTRVSEISSDPNDDYDNTYFVCCTGCNNPQCKAKYAVSSRGRTKTKKFHRRSYLVAVDLKGATESDYSDFPDGEMYMDFDPETVGQVLAIARSRDSLNSQYDNNDVQRLTAIETAEDKTPIYYRDEANFKGHHAETTALRAPRTTTTCDDYSLLSCVVGLCANPRCRSLGMSYCGGYCETCCHYGGLSACTIKDCDMCYLLDQIYQYDHMLNMSDRFENQLCRRHGIRACRPCKLTAYSESKTRHTTKSKKKCLSTDCRKDALRFGYCLDCLFFSKEVSAESASKRAYMEEQVFKISAMGRKGQKAKLADRKFTDEMGYHLQETPVSSTSQYFDDSLWHGKQAGEKNWAALKVAKPSAYSYKWQDGKLIESTGANSSRAAEEYLGKEVQTRCVGPKCDRPGDYSDNLCYDCYNELYCGNVEAVKSGRYENKEVDLTPNASRNASRKDRQNMGGTVCCSGEALGNSEQKGSKSYDNAEARRNSRTAGKTEEENTYPSIEGVPLIKSLEKNNLIRGETEGSGVSSDDRVGKKMFGCSKTDLSQKSGEVERGEGEGEDGIKCSAPDCCEPADDDYEGLCEACYIELCMGDTNKSKAKKRKSRAVTPSGDSASPALDVRHFSPSMLSTSSEMLSTDSFEPRLLPPEQSRDELLTFFSSNNLHGPQVFHTENNNCDTLAATLLASDSASPVQQNSRTHSLSMEIFVR